MNLATNRKKKLYALLTLLSIFVVNAAIINVNYIPNNVNGKLIDEVFIEPKNTDLTSNNIYIGTGDAWNVTHWANRTDYNLPANFGNNSYDLLEVPLGIDWIGYNLKADINNLYDSRNWNNGTFDFGNDDGTYAAGEDDTADISNSFQNWTFSFNDGATPNPMSGNYLDSGYAPSDGHDTLELRMDGNPSVLSGYYNYNEKDKCWWNSTFVIPRGTVIDSELQFEINPYYLANFNSWDFAVSLNNQPIFSSGTYSLKQLGEGNWQSFSIPQSVWVNQSNIYTSPMNSSTMPIEFSLEYVANSASYSQGFNHIENQTLFIDDVKLIVKAEVKPSQIQLKVNNTSVSDVDWGKGIVELTGDWQSTKVFTNFSSDDTWDLGSYDIELNADLNLFANKHTPETSYDTNFASEGISFYTENNSIVNWECYAYFAVPTGYEETTMKLDFPSDVNITWVSEPQQPTTNRLALCDNSTAGVLSIPVNAISTTPDGFWKFEGTSSNYCEQLTIYKNSTNSPTGVDWVQENEFLSGDYINITAKVNPSPLVSSYITQTNGIMNIRFPNGTIWTAQNQIKSCDSNGMVYFDYFQAPMNPPNYEVGEYEVIITWNNSHSNFGLNESGVIYKKFTVKHFSSLTPDQLYYANILEGSTINLIVSFTDRQNGDAIENAIVYLYNFTGGIEYFNEINPGFYALLDFNTTGGDAGDNILSIYANSTLYTNNQADTTINLILKTTLSAEEFPYIQVPWNQNFTIHLNYTETNTGNGIVTTPKTNWIGDYSTIMTSPGVYNMTFDTSAYEVNKLHSLLISVNESNYEQQSILIKVDITERSTNIDEIYLNQVQTTSIVIPYGEMLNITGKYMDDTGYFIDGAVVQLKDGAIIIGNFVKHPIYDQYNLTINSSILGLGVHSLTLYAKQDNYSIALESVVITVSERGTNLEIYLNAIETTSIEIPYGELVNITGKYMDDTGYFIDGAVVQLKDGAIIIGNFVKHPIYDQYNLTINSSILGLGVHSLTLYAKQDNYSITLESIVISVVQRDTIIDEIFLNDIDKTTDKSITITSGELLNITLKYKDSLTSNFISGASTTITGGGLSGGLNEDFVFNHYSRVINSSIFGLGAIFLTISIQAENYSAAAVSLTIFVSERGSVADIFINGSQYPDNYIIVEVWQRINITITYDDLITGNHLSNATVELLGIGYLTESPAFEQYTIIIDAATLGQGIDILNIIARKENYESQPLQITVEIIERKTDLYLYMNGLNKTLDKFIELPIGSQINFTIDYFDSTGQFVSGALVQLLGEGLSLNLTESIIFHHYSITINTNQLDIGIRLLTIIAFKNNYQIQTIGIRLDVQRIKTNITTISGESVINIRPGETVSLKIILYDLDFGGTIKNATVSFTWSGGSGTLTDANNDGIYEAVISNIPDGSHTITISAYAGDDYSFERYEVIITVIRPPEDILLFWILLIVSSIATVSALTYLVLYQKIFKYPKPVRKVRKYRKTLRKTKNPRVDVTAREKAFKGEYQNELAKSSKLLKGKTAEVTSKPDKMLKEPIESSDE